MAGTLGPNVTYGIAAILTFFIRSETSFRVASLVELSVARIIRHGHLTDIHTDIRTDIRVGIQVNGQWARISLWMSAPSDHSHKYPKGKRADVRLEFSVLRTVRPGMVCGLYFIIIIFLW